MAAGAVFTAPDGQPGAAAIRAELQALTTPSVGDLLLAGQIFRARIRQRTFAGVDVNGAPFAPYSTNGPYYLYVNRDAASGRTAEGRAARATASKNRHAKTGRIGIRTATGIRYESYAAAKAAHGAANVNLFGMEQHPHMLDAIMVRAGGVESSGAGRGPSDVFEQNQPCNSLAIGFYDDTAERAKGHNEGTSPRPKTSKARAKGKAQSPGGGLPKREFFALNQDDLDLAGKSIARRMMLRAKRTVKGFDSMMAGAQQPVDASRVLGEDEAQSLFEDVGF